MGINSKFIMIISALFVGLTLGHANAAEQPNAGGP